MLDEGVDIPRISHALVLASSTTRRQFIQRRGRVLRKHDSKHRAVVHDLIVDTSGFREPDSVSFMRSELARALEFVRSAVDSETTEIRIRELALEAQVHIEDDDAGAGRRGRHRERGLMAGKSDTDAKKVLEKIRAASYTEGVTGEMLQGDLCPGARASSSRTTEGLFKRRFTT